MTTWRRLYGDERGLEGIEYLLIAALVIIAAIGAWRFLGQRISSDVKDVAGTIDATVEDSIKTGAAESETPSPGVTVSSPVAPPQNAGISVKATGPGWSQAGPAYQTTGSFSLQVQVDKPGTIMDSVGILGAPKGSFALSATSDGRIVFQVYDPSANSPGRVSNGWHLITSDPVDLGATTQVSVSYGVNGTTLTVNGRDYAMPELKTPLSGQPVHLGDFSGDNRQMGFTGSIDGLKFSGPAG